MTLLEENTEQVEALKRIHGNILDLIALYGAEFRQIITDYEKQFGECPKAADLLWIASEHAGKDITKGE